MFKNSSGETKGLRLTDLKKIMSFNIMIMMIIIIFFTKCNLSYHLICYNKLIK